MKPTTYKNDSYVQYWTDENGTSVKTKGELDHIFQVMIDRIIPHEYVLCINYSISQIDCYIGRLGGRNGACAVMYSHSKLTEDEAMKHAERIYNDIMEGKHKDLPYKDKEFWDVFHSLVEDDKKGIKQPSKVFPIEHIETIEKFRKDFKGNPLFIDNYDKDKTITLIEDPFRKR